MKQAIFIGSSAESLETAHQVQEYFKTKYDCLIWIDHFFELNFATYRNLFQKAACFDYAIFIGGKDDAVLRLSTKSKKTAPRDNIYLEFGLYAGILSPARTYFLIHKDCTIASDLHGITLLPYSNKKDILGSCEQINSKIQEENKINRISLLPSTSLALGYYENFLIKSAPALFDIKEIEVDGNVHDVEMLPKSLEIIIPDCDADLQSWAEIYYKQNHAEKIYLDCKLRKMGVLLDRQTLLHKNEVRLIDVPQPLRIAFEAVDMVFGKDYIGSTPFLKRAKRKETNNFVKTLENKIKENSYCTEFVKIKMDDL